MALSQGHQHGGLRRSVAGVVGARGAWAVGHDDHPAEGRVGAGVPGLVEAVIGAPVLCLRLGRRRVLQRPARGHRQQTAMHSGADGRHPGRNEGAHRDHRWLPGERTVVARAAAGRPAPRAHDRSRAGHRGRRPRLLGRGAESVSADPGAALLGPQDGQCAEHASHGRAAQGESHALRHLDGGDAAGGRPGLRYSSWPRLPRSSQPRPRVSPRTGTCA